MCVTLKHLPYKLHCFDCPPLRSSVYRPLLVCVSEIAQDPEESIWA